MMKRILKRNFHSNIQLFHIHSFLWEFSIYQKKNIGTKTVNRAMSIKESLMDEVVKPLASSGNKITVVGIGQVGMACVFSILTQVISIFIY